jgi:5'(3')-deoxyribonucleotidase
MKMDFTIALDVDGVCYSFDSCARYLLRTERGYKNLIYPSTDWDYIERMVEPRDWEWLWTEGVSLGLFRYGHVVTGAIEGVRKLRRLGDVVFVTHRPTVAVQDTLDWLSYARFEPAGVHILSENQPKTSVPADVYIDDRRENLAAVMLSGSGADAVCFDQPHNQGNIPGDNQPRFWRAIGWPRVVEICTVIKNRGSGA